MWRKVGYVLWVNITSLNIWFVYLVRMSACRKFNCSSRSVRFRVLRSYCQAAISSETANMQILTLACRQRDGMLRLVSISISISFINWDDVSWYVRTHLQRGKQPHQYKDANYWSLYHPSHILTILGWWQLKCAASYKFKLKFKTYLFFLVTYTEMCGILLWMTSRHTN